MTGLFSVIPLSTVEHDARFELRLDAAEPYLDDHRPGGEPLFSTVMGLEALAGAARTLTSSTALAAISHIRVKAPYILRGGGPHAVELRVRRSPTNPLTDFDCVMLTPATTASATIHLEARVHLGAEPPSPAEPADSGTSPSAPSAVDFAGEATAGPPVPGPVPGASVYELFFHGPSYRVVSSAQWSHDQIICRLTRGLPPSHRDAGRTSEIAPRLVEFGLQSAGLLELAASGRMMIPHSIARIVRTLPVDVDVDASIHARAHLQVIAERRHIDIEILDEHGRTLLAIHEYRTLPLPFAVDAVGQARLSARLRGNQTHNRNFPTALQSIDQTT